MKNNSTLVAIGVFIGVLVVFIVGYFVFKPTKKVYSCTNYETNEVYTFDSEEEMHKVCDNLSNDDDDQLLESYPIYKDLVNTNDSSFAFYPYINSDKKLSIIIAVTDCNNVEGAKEKVKKWFSNHSYNINDYTIEYEYPCDIS